MAKSPKQEVAPITPRSGAVDVPDWMKEYQGEGQQDINRDDILMPRLKLGQSMTPEVKDGLAKEGDFIHSITKEVLCAAGDILPIIPITYAKEYILWYDRKGPHGGGLAARARRTPVVGGIVRYMWDKPNTVFEDKLEGKIQVRYQTARFIDEDHLGDWGSQIPGDKESGPAATETHNYVVMLPTFNYDMIALSLSRTANRKAKEFNSMLKMGTVPTYARIYKLASVPDQSGDNKFANYAFSGFELVRDQELFHKLRAMHESLKERGFNVDYSDEESSHTSAPAQDDGKF
jgi:hypothetical protein